MILTTEAMMMLRLFHCQALDLVSNMGLKLPTSGVYGANFR
jgi:hypothetical protein